MKTLILIGAFALIAIPSFSQTLTNVVATSVAPPPVLPHYKVIIQNAVVQMGITPVAGKKYIVVGGLVAKDGSLTLTVIPR